MRLGPAPYAWLNYACSLSSDIRFGSYILASIIGRSPHNLIDIYIGSGVNTAGEAASYALPFSPTPVVCKTVLPFLMQDSSSS